jgi:hypothetical protein
MPQTQELPCSLGEAELACTGSRFLSTLSHMHESPVIGCLSYALTEGSGMNRCFPPRTEAETCLDESVRARGSGRHEA